MNPNIKTIIDFISEQMDGGSVPTTNSAELAKISKSIEDLHSANSQDEFELLGIKTLGAVIDRIRSNMAAERALHTFIRGGEL